MPFLHTIPARNLHFNSVPHTAGSFPATQSSPPVPGRMLAQATGLPVHCYLSGKLGGIQQISSRVACDEVDLVLFFRDPLKADTGNSSEQNLLRLCDMHSVPIATNIATAEVLLRGLDQGDLDYRDGMHPEILEPISVHCAVC